MANKSSRLYRVTECVDIITGATEVGDGERRTSQICHFAKQTGTIHPSGMQTDRWLAASKTCYAAFSTAEVEPSSRAAKFFNSSPVMWDVSLNTETISMRRLFSWVAVVGFGM